MADDQFQTRDDRDWLEANQWSIWTTGYDLHATHEKRVPYIIDTEKMYEIPVLGNNPPDSPSGPGETQAEIRGAAAEYEGPPDDDPVQTKDD